jgi:hypothetical protein
MNYTQMLFTGCLKHIITSLVPRSTFLKCRLQKLFVYLQYKRLKYEFEMSGWKANSLSTPRGSGYRMPAL